MTLQQPTSHKKVELSASPELFFEWTRDGLRCRPMKGTAPRGRTPSEDAKNRDVLARSGKDIAENVMIVDLLRNDLGRVAVPGTVAVSSLLDVEQYESVWQLTSSITARPRADVTLTDVFAALFPCGSVTGAPKIAAAAAIADVEDTPRGFYCGAIGWVAPRGEGVRARFNVAIRTVTVDHDGSAVYGSGGGITIGSTAAAEFRELLDKTAVLSRVASEPLFLLETLRHDTSGFVHLHRHLARLQRTAAGFGFPLDEEMVRKSLDDAVAGHAGPLRVSLRLAAGGAVTVAATPYEASAVPVRVALDERPVESASFWLRHKTSRRDVYESARARHPDADDVVLRNERGEITESTIANVGVRLDGRWYTPPIESGCLPGVGRAIALERGDLTERTISVDEFVAAERIALINSLRGWRPATI